MSPRSAEAVPSLARLLAELPADRLRSVARAWGAEEAGGSAAVYRRITSPEAARAAREGLDAREQLLFDTVRVARAVDRDDLLRKLPFGDEELDQLLAKLEGLGLIWPRGVRGEGGSSRRVWFVPSDLATALARPAAKPTDRSGIPDRPLPAPLEREPGAARAFGQVPPLVTNPRQEAVSSVSTSSPRDYARHCGVALGVWSETGEPGPRHAAWRDLDDAGRVRALARLWLVDDAAPGTPPDAVRQAFWETLRALEPEKWYNLGEVARRIAWEAGRTGAGRGFGRDQIQAAVVTLAWLGVVRFAVDERVRPIALSITAWGAGALL